MKNNPIVFDSSVAQNYDDLLGSFVFEPFAINLVENIPELKTGTVLEIACGTGRVTKHLREQLPKEVTLTATDLNSGMIAVAKQKVTDSTIIWETADMLNLNYKDASFDVVVCQFGVMFAPDKAKAFLEIRRVLKNGGTLVFNTWDTIINNKPFLITNTVVNSFLGKEPTTMFKEGPFCMDDEKAVLQLLEEAGFKNNTANLVTQLSEAKSAEIAAKGFITGLPTLNLILDKIPDLLPDIIETIKQQFSAELGNEPLKASMQAWLFTSVK